MGAGLIICGNSLVELAKLKENSVDAVVTDPPYELGFMGKAWDNTGIAYRKDLWQEVIRVLKSGGHLLSFGGSRTYHRMACAIEDAGFEIRDQIMWVYGSGFPKSLNIGKVVDKFLKTGNASWNGTGDSSNGALGYSKLQHNQDYRPADYSNRHQNKSEITEEKAKEWNGWGTALKPAHEPIVLARKPLSEKTVAENVLKWGVGGINIDGCRVAGNYKWRASDSKVDGDIFKQGSFGEKPNELGRFPANFIHDGIQTEWSRFFYCAKASKSERDRGCEELPERARPTMGSGIGGQPDQQRANNRNNHPTVKPLALMKYLIKLVSREGQVILDPFMGSGTTGIAAKELKREFIGIEMNPEYIEIAKRRIGD